MRCAFGAFRAFLVWALVIAMPVQGMAASAMLFCGPGHDRMAQAVATEASAVASAQAAGHGHGHGHEHDASAADHGSHRPPASGHRMAHAPAAAPDADGSWDLVPDLGSAGCSACAAHCAALALPSSFMLSEPASPMHLVRTSSVEPIASHPRERLDRPPRTVRA